MKFSNGFGEQILGSFLCLSWKKKPMKNVLTFNGLMSSVTLIHKEKYFHTLIFFLITSIGFSFPTSLINILLEFLVFRIFPK